MSALVAAIETSPKLCSVAEARTQLDTESAADFDAWMAGKTVIHKGREIKLTDIDMWQALQGLGHRVGKQTCGRHRRGRGECGCTA